jgi:glycosyltransferase involved in cell wall biosynthesis
MPKARLLFLCQTLPYPPDNGVNVRSFNTLKILAGAFDVTSLFFYRKANRPRAEDVRRAVEELAPWTRAEAFPIPQEHSKARLLWDHACSTVGRRPYTYHAYRSAAVEGRLRALFESERFDLVHVDSLDLSAYLPTFRGIPVACTHHNVESQLLRRRATAVANPILRRYVGLQATLTDAEERRWCPRVDVNVAVSDDDCALLREMAPSSRFIVVPNGVDTDYFQPRSGAAKSVVFVGGYDWFPNRDAMEYFSEVILPPLRERCPHVPVTWVGKAPPAAVERFEGQGIRMAGFIDDLRPVVADAACYIAPLRVGGGTRLKLVEGMAMGKAIVSTSQGSEGLRIDDGENMLVRDDPTAFAAAIQQVVEDAALRVRLEDGARRTAVELYDWRVVGAVLTDTYGEVIAEGSGERGRATRGSR